MGPVPRRFRQPLRLQSSVHYTHDFRLRLWDREFRCFRVFLSLSLVHSSEQQLLASLPPHSDLPLTLLNLLGHGRNDVLRSSSIAVETTVGVDVSPDS